MQPLVSCNDVIPIMKLIKIYSAITFTILFNSCIGFMDGYHRLILQDESSNIYLTKDSSAYFNDEDFALIFNESVTNINPISQRKEFFYVFIDTKIKPKKDLLIKTDYFVLTDSLDKSYKATKLVVDREFRDSLILLKNNIYNVNFTFESIGKKETVYYYPPYKMSFEYKLVESDSLKNFIKDYIFNVDYSE